MKLAPQFSATLWSAATAYAIGDLVYDDTSGNTYISIQAGTNHLVTDAAYWTAVPFPEEIADLVVRGATAEALREDGQFDKGKDEEASTWADAAIKFGVQLRQPFDIVTDQSRMATRYRPPTTAPAQ